jgi:hypothetical protein
MPELVNSRNPAWSVVDQVIEGQNVKVLDVYQGLVVRQDDFQLLLELFTEFWEQIKEDDSLAQKVRGDVIALAIRALWPGQSFTSICLPYGDEQRQWSPFHLRRAEAFRGMILHCLFIIMN